PLPAPWPERDGETSDHQGPAERREDREWLTQQQGPQQRPDDRLDVQKDRGPGGRAPGERPVPDDVPERRDDDGQIEGAGQGLPGPDRPSPRSPLERGER